MLHILDWGWKGLWGILCATAPYEGFGFGHEPRLSGPATVRQGCGHDWKAPHASWIDHGYAHGCACGCGVDAIVEGGAPYVACLRVCAQLTRRM